MSDTITGLRRKIDSAGDLQSVVRTMKALAASSIGQYEKAVHALADYKRTVDLGLGASFRAQEQQPSLFEYDEGLGSTVICAVVFGSDQGMVGQYNEVISDFAMETLVSVAAEADVWAVGERVHARLADAGVRPEKLFTVPNSVDAIGGLVGQILVETEARLGKAQSAGLHLFYNRPTSGALYTPITQHLLPLDDSWRRAMLELHWPTSRPPEILGGASPPLGALVREYLFISLFGACAESLASENASRLAAMERADKNIDDLLEDLSGRFHRLRQSSIDEELFDVISGVEALTKVAGTGTAGKGCTQ